MSQDNFQEFLLPRPALSAGGLHSTDPRKESGDIRQTVQRLLGIERTEPLEIISVQEGAQGTFWAEQLLFKSRSGRILRATILRPSREKRYPGVLVCPGRNATLSRVTGADSPDYPDRDVAKKLTASGITTITLEYELDGMLNAEMGRRDEVNISGPAPDVPGSLPLSFLVQNALSAVSLLRDDPRIQSDKIALFGHSLGAYIALCTGLALDHEVPVALASFFRPDINVLTGELAGSAAHAFPIKLGNVDLPNLVAALAPAPLQVQHGLEDHVLPVDQAKPGLELVLRSYVKAGAPEAVELLTLGMGHGTDITHLRRFLEANFNKGAADNVIVPAAEVHFDADTRREILDGIDKALASGVLTLGPMGQEFEMLVQHWTGAPYTVAVSSGSAALELALILVGVKGRRVLIPANTFFATALSVLHAGAILEFVDIEPVGLGMDPSRLKESLAEYPDVAAVVVVHIGGIVAPSLIQVLRICEERSIPVIEDAAHALGSTLHGAFAGNIGKIGAFSMYPTKVATSAEGGFITAQLENHARDAQSRRDQGKQSFQVNVHDRIGSNWRMSELHASVGVATMKRLADSLRARRELAARYDSGLSDLPGLQPFPVPPECNSNYYKYIALLDGTIDREDLKRRLKANHNVALAGEVYQLACCAQPYFQEKYSEEQFAFAYDFCRRNICLPLFPSMTAAQHNAVLRALAIEVDRAAIPAD